MTDADRIQDLLTRVGALTKALDECLSELIAAYGDQARTKIEDMAMARLILRWPSTRSMQLR
jgi:chemotaxis regulatin CheY-phosphate phosphatase CheZ